MYLRQGKYSRGGKVPQSGRIFNPAAVHPAKQAVHREPGCQINNPSQVKTGQI